MKLILWKLVLNRNYEFHFVCYLLKIAQSFSIDSKLIHSKFFLYGVFFHAHPLPFLAFTVFLLLFCWFKVFFSVLVCSLLFIFFPFNCCVQKSSLNQTGTSHYLHRTYSAWLCQYCKRGNFRASNFLRFSDLTFLLVFKFVFFSHPT